jgi:hypothetical protein
VTLVGGLMLSPWFIRNYINTGEVFFTKNAGAYLRDQWVQVAQFELEHNEEAISAYQKALEEGILAPNKYIASKALTKIYLGALFDMSFISHVKAGAYSIGRHFLSGGAASYANYLGLSGAGFTEHLSDTKSENSLLYLIIITLCLGFAFITRLLGLLGFFILFRKDLKLYGVLFFLVNSLLMFTYLYLGQSRFRVPMEPILMIYAGVGIYAIKSYIYRLK